MSAGLIFNESIDASPFKIEHEYLCVCSGAYCSHGTAFVLKVKICVKK